MGAKHSRSSLRGPPRGPSLAPIPALRVSGWVGGVNDSGNDIPCGDFPPEVATRGGKCEYEGIIWSHILRFAGPDMRILGRGQNGMLYSFGTGL